MSTPAVRVPGLGRQEAFRAVWRDEASWPGCVPELRSKQEPGRLGAAPQRPATFESYVCVRFLLGAEA